MELKQIIVPLALFVCITYAFRVLVDAVMRYRMLREPGTEDLLRSILQGEQAERRLSSLRWGLLATFLAIAFAIQLEIAAIAFRGDRRERRTIED